MSALVVRVPVRFEREARGRKVLVEGSAPAPETHIPRLARLLALAIRIEERVRAGEIRDYAHAADLGGVTRARLTQIMDLTLLAPDIQEEILDMEPVAGVRDGVPERLVRPIALEPDWERQRTMWRALRSRVRNSAPALNSRIGYNGSSAW